MTSVKLDRNNVEVDKDYFPSPQSPEDLSAPKVNQVASRSFCQQTWAFTEGVIESKVFRTILITALVLASLFLLVSNPIGWIATTLGVSILAAKFIGAGAVIGLNLLNFAIQKQKFEFEMSALHRLLSDSKKCHEIPLDGLDHIQPGAGLYLGPLPNKDHPYTEELMKEGKWAILSINEPFEREPAGVSNPYTKRDWEEKNIPYKKITSKDHKLLSVEEMDKAADWIHRQIRAGRKVYVHCRAGVGRSATAIAAYLMKFGKTNDQLLSLEDICFRIKTARPKATIWDKLSALADYQEALLGKEGDTWSDRPSSGERFKKMLYKQDDMIKEKKKTKASKEDVAQITAELQAQ